MNIKWGTYPSHLGHESSPGASAVHDAEHTDEKGAVIANDCGTCHTALATQEEDPEILKTLQP
jgi:hypothetical protein